jgi:antitoxin YefM
LEFSFLGNFFQSTARRGVCQEAWNCAAPRKKTLAKYFLDNQEQYIVQYIVPNNILKAVLFMLAVNYSNIRNNLKNYCDKVTDEYETVVVTRKNEKNVVLLSLVEYNALTKAARNAEYLNMLDRAMEQIARGEGKLHELIEADDE